jgi:flavin reductase (DIM6/NTAB) family NADH-FMN oxidoreductase RutF
VDKIKCPVKGILYPMPCSIVGANVDGKPNYMTLAWFSMVNSKPPYVMVVIDKSHYTYAGVKENGTFSLNIPQADLAEKTDYCGLVSGRQVDKSRLFDTFYGQLGTAPMIKECAFNAECRLVQTVKLPIGELLIGEVVDAYTEERYLSEGLPDPRKTNPMVLLVPQRMYAGLGPDIAPAWKVGKGLFNKG